MVEMANTQCLNFNHEVMEKFLLSNEKRTNIV